MKTVLAAFLMIFVIIIELTGHLLAVISLRKPAILIFRFSDYLENKIDKFQGVRN